MVQLGADATYSKDDFYLLAALDAKYLGDKESAAKYFEKLYFDTKNLDFAYEALKWYGSIKDFKKVKEILNQALKDHPNDINLKRYSVAFYIDTKDFKTADKLIGTIPLDSSPKMQDAQKMLRATIDLGLGKTQKALKFFKDKYNKNKTANNALVLSDLLERVGKVDEAIKVLKNHTDFIECDENICARLITYYKDKNEVDPIIDLTKRLYKKTKKLSYANMLITLYRYIDDKDKAIDFLKKNHINDRLLLDLYLSKKDYKSAKELAKRLYSESGDLDMLAQLMMIEYESREKKDKKFLNYFSKNFDRVVQHIDDPIYNNFYGYVLIDENIDVKKGMQLVKKALAKKPKAPFFIDSLAWGYYRNGDCQKALETIEPIVEGAKAKEIKDHYKKIRECQ
ncbi:MAG: hypothetical protein DSZ06_02905 [Sulfurospirillum sp.]|nr:MAG: hypothetical protein DSZ06_02905 [Sulfurospirillum sp.]